MTPGNVALGQETALNACRHFFAASLSLLLSHHLPSTRLKAGNALPQKYLGRNMAW